MRLIDADELIERIPKLRKWFNRKVSDHAVTWAKWLVNSQQTIDAVPVVRCKDCIHWRLYEPDVDVGKCVKHNDHIARWEDDFCSYGARMDGEG